MKSYRVDITPRSPWGTPLHADSLFGHLCWALTYLRGEKALRDFLLAFDGSQPPLVLSNGFPKGCLPRPLLPAVSIQREGQDPTDRKKLKHKTLLAEEWLLSARNGLTEEKIQQALLSDPKEEEESVGKKDPWREELGYHNTIDRWSNSVRDEGGFFQSMDYHLPPDSRLNVYIKTDYFSETVLGELLDIVKKGGFGRDKSAGLGSFNFALSTFAFSSMPGANAFISLSNFVPSPHDPTEGYYDLMTKFGKLGGDFAVGPVSNGGKHNPFKKPLIMLRSGSVFRDTQVREWYGRLVAGVHTNSEIHHYGLCYPLEVRL
jgi:CRISPR-associated protein Csm4